MTFHPRMHCRPERFSIGQYVASAFTLIALLLLLVLAITQLGGCTAEGVVGPQVQAEAGSLVVKNTTANSYQWVDAVEEPVLGPDGHPLIVGGQVVMKTVKPGTWTAVTSGPVTGVQQPGQTIFKANQVTRDMTKGDFLLSSGDGVDVRGAKFDAKTGAFSVDSLTFDSAASIAALEPLQKQITAGVAITSPDQLQLFKSETERYITTVKEISPVLGTALQAALSAFGVPGA